MQLDEVRRRYLAFFEKHGHAVIPSSSLVPENDPTTLFTGSGMQPLLPFLLGQKHPQGRRLVDSQKCFRSVDIEEVGDNRHTTFFEMLGNWSLGDYFKEEQLSWFFEFLTDEKKGVGLDSKRLYVTIFSGDESNNIPKDTESAIIWKKLFKEKDVDAKDVELITENVGAEKGMQGGHIFYYDAQKNWWSRSGVPANMPSGEPGGPDSEVFYDFYPEAGERCVMEGHDEYCHPNCDCGRFVEIGNSVFMQYIKQEDRSFKELPQKNVDFGGGLERIVAATENEADIFKTGTLALICKNLERDADVAYGDSMEATKAYRIITDHMRAASFLLADGVVPTKSDRGYFLRRLIRRSVRYADKIGLIEGSLGQVYEMVSKEYTKQYPELKDRHQSLIQEEEARFRKTLTRGLKEIGRIIKNREVVAKDVFDLVTTYGFPLELIEEEMVLKSVNIPSKTELENLFKQHKDTSRAGSKEKFKGGLADSNETTTMLHTATHLMLAGLRKELGDSVHQAGSNITEERTRFDFTHTEKVQRDVLDRVEAYVNKAIAKKCHVQTTVMLKEEAQASGVEGSFWEKYPEKVTVYEVVCSDGTVYSRELCGGPHVKNTADIKGIFKIIKEESSSAGIRRVKAMLE